MDEDAFLIALRNNPNDETTRLVYADWLDERNDPRGAFVRLEREYIALPPADKRRAELATQLRGLARTLDRAWLRIVSRPAVENCGAEDAFKMAFECPKRWDQLQPTDNPRVRHCDACQQSVHYCDTIVEARAKAGRSECVAIALPVRRVPGDMQSRPLLLERIEVCRPTLRTTTPPEDDEDAPPPRKRKRR